MIKIFLGFSLQLLLLMVTIFASHPALAEQYRIGIAEWSDYPENIAGFQAGLAAQGFNQKNVEFINRNSQSDPQRQHKIATEFNTLDLDLIYSLTTTGTIIIKENVSPTIPIVFSLITYPADAGLIESFDYSGNNLVGTSNFINIKHIINLFTQMLPDAKRVVIFHRYNEPNSIMQSHSLHYQFKRQGIEAIIKNPKDLSQLALMANENIKGVDAYVATLDSLIQNGGEQQLIAIAKQRNIPILSLNKKGIQQGSTFGLVTDAYHLGEISGQMAAKILSGKSKPSQLSTLLQQHPTLLVNRSSIDRLKITVPTTLEDVIYVE